MLYFAHKLLTEEIYKDFRKKLLISDQWMDGIHSTIGNTQEIKRNLELGLSDDYEELSGDIIEILKKDQIFQSFAMPAKIFSLLFTRTGKGMYYGPHIDSPYIFGQGRRDLSFTIFLNQPNEYQGGELILNITPEKKSIKLRAGEMIVYPTKYLHEVKEVTEGERMVCVGWIQSQIASNEDRESIYLVKQGLSEIIKTHGFSSSASKIYNGISNIHKRFIN
jgi:PKHD-type hydroxylase